jgi:hypothetical protein
MMDATPSPFVSSEVETRRAHRFSTSLEANGKVFEGLKTRS